MYFFMSTVSGRGRATVSLESARLNAIQSFWVIFALARGEELDFFVVSELKQTNNKKSATNEQVSTPLQLYLNNKIRGLSPAELHGFLQLILWLGLKCSQQRLNGCWIGMHFTWNTLKTFGGDVRIVMYSVKGYWGNKNFSSK